MGEQGPSVGTGALAAADLGGTVCEPHHSTTEQITYKLENNYTKEVAATPQQTEPDLPVSVQGSPTEMWVNMACHGVRDTEYNGPGISPFEGGRD